MANLVLFLRDSVQMTPEVRASFAHIGFSISDYLETVHAVVGEIDDAKINDIRNFPAVEWVEVRKAANVSNPT